MNLCVKTDDARTHIADCISDCPMVEVLRTVRDGRPDSQLTHIGLLVFHLWQKHKDSSKVLPIFNVQSTSLQKALGKGGYHTHTQKDGRGDNPTQVEI